MSWIFMDKLVTEDSTPAGAIGFVYKIVHIPTGKFYIGKKNLVSTRRLKIGKRELQSIKESRKADGILGRLPSKKTVKTDSDWETYYSSNEELIQMVKDGKADELRREIIQFCFSKKALSYYELYWQFKYDVLIVDDCYNNNIGGTYYRKDLI